MDLGSRAGAHGRTGGPAWEQVFGQPFWPTWTLIAELLRRNPRLHGTLADLLETPARARQYLAGSAWTAGARSSARASSTRCLPARRPTCSPHHP